jgi:hypothetical protein
MRSNILSKTRAQHWRPHSPAYLLKQLASSTAIIVMCLTAWSICFFLYLGALFTIDHDTHTPARKMAERAKAM